MPAVLGVEEISRGEIWRVIWLMDVMVGFADAGVKGGRKRGCGDAADDVEDKQCNAHEVRI